MAAKNSARGPQRGGSRSGTGVHIGKTRSSRGSLQQVRRPSSLFQQPVKPVRRLSNNVPDEPNPLQSQIDKLELSQIQERIFELEISRAENIDNTVDGLLPSDII